MNAFTIPTSLFSSHTTFPEFQDVDDLPFQLVNEIILKLNRNLLHLTMSILSFKETLF